MTVMAATAAKEQRSPVGIWPEGAAYVEGAFVPIEEARIPVTDWGFTRSDCTYDVVHVWGGQFFRLADHLDRFEKSCRGLRLTNPLGRQEVENVLMELVRRSGLKEAYVEVIVTRGLPAKGSRDPRLCSNRFYAFAIPFLWIATEEMRQRGINLHVSSVLRIPPRSVDPRIKNFHWADMTRSLFEAYDAGCDMPVLLDEDGNLAEGPGFNIFVVEGGRVTTPEGTCLDGITRQTAIDLLGEENVELVRGAVSPDRLRAADEAFITSTAGGILPVTKVDGAPLGGGEAGPLTLRLREVYWRRHGQGWHATPVDYEP